MVRRKTPEREKEKANIHHSNSQLEMIMISIGAYHRLVFCLSIGALFSHMLIGCASEKMNHVGIDEHQMLQAFVSEDVFAVPAGSVYPEPAATPTEILAYAAQGYDTNCEVRRLLAVYFLRYDSALLSRGLVTATTDPKCLIGLLWNKEATGWEEIPSMERMRQHLADLVENFCLQASDLRLLEKNKREFERIVDFWKEQ